MKPRTPTVDEALAALRRTVEAERTEAIRARLTAFWSEAGTPAEATNGKPKRKMSQAGRARIAAAARKRWREYNKRKAGKK